MTKPMRAAGVLLAATALTTMTAVGPAQASPSQESKRAAQARVGTDDAALDAAAPWLAKQLTGGLFVGPQGPDYGLSIDAGMALNEAGDRTTVAAISNAVEAGLKTYIGDDKEIYAGPTAKAAVFARTARANVTSYGGTNLITRLEKQVTDAAATAGRIEDTSQYGDYANVVGQSYAVRALSLANSGKAAKARDFLLKQQCASGFFRLNFSDAKATEQGCVEGTAGSEADPDATSIAVISLVRSRDNSAEVKAAIAKASAWLAGRQRRSGAFTGGPSTVVLNANSTGLAASALAAADRPMEAALAASWVRKMQPVDRNRCRSALSKDRGAVGYTRKAVSDARTSGITPETRGEWVRATAQGILALQFAPKAPQGLSVEPFRMRARAGQGVRMRMFGLAPGEQACLSIQGHFKRVNGNATGSAFVRELKMPRGNVWRTAKLHVIDQAARARVKVRN